MSLSNTYISIDNYPDGIIIIDPKGTILEINCKVLQLIHYKSSELINSTIWQFLAKNYKNKTQLIKLTKSYQNNTLENHMAELEVLNKDGDHILFEANCSIDKKNSQQIIISLRDITNRSHAKLLYQKNTDLAQYCYIVSHDLQEPLGVINSFVNLLEDELEDNQSDDVQKYFNYIKNASIDMKQYMKGLLEYTKLGEESIFVDMDLNVLFNNVKVLLTDEIKANNAIITYDNLPTLEVLPYELRLCLYHLIHNSIKYKRKDVTPEIHFGCKLIEGKYLFTIKDNGIGISDKYYEKIFIIFQRLHVKREYKGTGIGLAYVKKIVQLHGGKIWLNSTPDNGTTFYFTLN